jgi:hypothetical protein
MANQFTKGSRSSQDDSTKDKIRAEVLSKRLEKYAKAKGKSIDKYRMEPAQVAAAKVLIERGKPALQAITQEIIEEQPSPSEAVGKLVSLLSANPSLLRPLLADPGFRASLQAMLDGSPAVVELPQRSAA